MATGRCSFTGRYAHTDESQFPRRSQLTDGSQFTENKRQSQLYLDPARHGRITEDSSTSFLTDPWRLSNLADDTTHPVARYDVTHKHKHKTADHHNISPLKEKFE